MSYTFSEAQSDVGSIINQSVSDDTKTVTNTEVKRWLNTAYKKLQRKVVEAKQDYYLQESTTDIVDSQNDYALPVDALKLERVEIGYESDVQKIVADKVTYNSVRTSNYQGSTASPIFSVHKNLIRIYPTPSENVTAGLLIAYYPQIADLTSSDEEFNLPLGYEEIPVLYAAAIAKRKLGLFDEAQELMNEFNTQAILMTHELIERVEDNMDLVRIVQDY